jgi:PAP2 superfamily
MTVAPAAKAHKGWIETAAAFALYAVYELVRGFGGTDYVAAKLHTADIVAFERRLGIFHELGIQQAAARVPGLPAFLGAAYISLHLLATTAFLVWVFKSRRGSFPLVRTTLVGSTAIALVIYVLYPAAPPRLTELGFSDTVSNGTGLNLSSDLLGALYNPLAAVPSLHFGYSLLVGVGIYVLAQRRWVRWLGAAYPVFMLYTIVATGNHFLLDAVAGGIVVVAAWAGARFVLDAPRPKQRKRSALLSA